MKVLLISPQHWGTMRVTKHHYAIEMAKLGHEVYFLEPTEASWKWNQTSFSVNPSDAEGVLLVQQQINVPYNLKFHLKGLFDWFIKRHIQKLENELGPFGLVWSFDLTNALPLKYFSKTSKKIFFAADWPANEQAVLAADSSDVIVSVAQEILDQYKRFQSAKLKLVPHGVAQCFFDAAATPYSKSDQQIRVGMSGNFLRTDIDRPTLLKVIKSHPELVFECFGSYQFQHSNLGGAADTETQAFITELQAQENVIMHGMLNPTQLALELRRMDLFLICYDVTKDQSKGTNYHKVMEYLVYSKPIVTNYVSSYIQLTERIFMPTTTENTELLELFENTLQNLPIELERFEVKGYGEVLNYIFL